MAKDITWITREELVYKLNHIASKTLLTKILDRLLCESCGKETKPLLDYHCVSCYNNQFKRKEQNEKINFSGMEQA